MDIHKRSVSIIELLIVLGIIVVIAGVSVWAVRGTLAHARDVIRLASVNQLYFGLESYFAAHNDYPKAENLVVSGPQTGCLDDNGFHALSTCSGKVYVPVITGNQSPGGAPFLYNYISGPPPSYIVRFSTEVRVGTLLPGVHTLSPSGIE